MVLLREILNWDDLSPLHNNLITSQLMVLYLKMTMELTFWLRKNYGLRGDITKQLLHVLQSSTVLFWPLFDTKDTWSWRLNALGAAVMAARGVYKGAIVKDPADIEVQTMTRSSSPSELLFGPWQFSFVMVWLGLSSRHFMSEEAAILAAALGIGDGIAPIMGDAFGRHVYQMPMSNKKTMEGSVVGVFLGTVFGCYLYLYLMGIPLLPLRLILAYGGLAAVVEGTAPNGLDNVAITVAIHLSMDKIKEWLPA